MWLGYQRNIGLNVPRDWPEKSLKPIVWILLDLPRTWKISAYMSLITLYVKSQLCIAYVNTGSESIDRGMRNTQLQRQGVEEQMVLYQLPGVGSCFVTDDFQKLLRLRIAEIGAAQGGDQSFERQQQGHISNIHSRYCRQRGQKSVDNIIYSSGSQPKFLSIYTQGKEHVTSGGLIKQHNSTTEAAIIEKKYTNVLRQQNCANRYLRVFIVNLICSTYLALPSFLTSSWKSLQVWVAQLLVE